MVEGEKVVEVIEKRDARKWEECRKWSRMTEREWDEEGIYTDYVEDSRVLEHVES